VSEHPAIPILKRRGEEVTRYLEGVLAGYVNAPARLMESIRYSVMAGGKRLRPALVLETYEVCAKLMGKAVELDRALPAAGAIELIHTFSLVHDDLPAMDDDDLRRGVPTNHKVFGEAMAILAGDAMVTMAFEVLAADAPVEVRGALVKDLAWAAGPAGMIGGQVLDMEAQERSMTLQELEGLHRRKTGALLTAACRMGAISATALVPMLDRMTRFGQHLGLAFQIVDDLLDLTATAEQLGKATRKDSKKGKKTYPALLGIEGSRKRARQEIERALSELEELKGAGAGLRQLAEFVGVRSA
jgi:geranylgeranyl diphosphate synthase type II